LHNHQLQGLLLGTADASPGADTVNLAPGYYEPSSTLVITDDLTINGGSGPGAIVDGGGGHDVFFVGDFVTGLQVFHNELTIENGSVGINYYAGTAASLLSVNRSTITGNGGIGLRVQARPAEIVNSTTSAAETLVRSPEAKTDKGPSVKCAGQAGPERPSPSLAPSEWTRTPPATPHKLRACCSPSVGGAVHVREGLA